jgi:hypothetical protein
MNKFILMIGLFVLCAGCSPNRQLAKKYEGKGREQLVQNFGEPTRIQKNDLNQDVFEYIKETIVRETTIGTGRATLDPRISPGFVKVEIRRFIIDSKGIVIKAEYEKLIR